MKFLLLLVCLVAVCQANKFRILHGVRVAKGEIPYQVLIETATKYDVLICGGALIGPQFVLTAAHCLSINAHTTAELGMVELDQKPLFKKKALKVIPHENYDPVNNDKDIGLVKIPRPPAALIHLVHLPTAAEEQVAGSVVRASGFGLTEDGGNEASPFLLKVDLRVLGDDECRKYWPVTENQMCATWTKHKDEAVCEGDSGSPLVLQQNGRHTIVGVVSFGSKGSCAEAPQVFTKVVKFRDWIHVNMV